MPREGQNGSVVSPFKRMENLTERIQAWIQLRHRSSKHTSRGEFPGSPRRFGRRDLVLGEELSNHYRISAATRQDDIWSSSGVELFNESKKVGNINGVVKETMNI
ncbi:unnamed protein product [Linum tenue]|uniref:Uncharacterized protein n=1 Tax=Linum tenue TaxID=586396 RepID=A0AAV0HZR2_9ROSI|nr:unnamed protein product [Linum tenue]